MRRLAVRITQDAVGTSRENHGNNGFPGPMAATEDATTLTGSPPPPPSFTPQTHRSTRPRFRKRLRKRPTPLVTPDPAVHPSRVLAHVRGLCDTVLRSDEPTSEVKASSYVLMRRRPAPPARDTLSLFQSMSPQGHSAMPARPKEPVVSAAPAPLPDARPHPRLWRWIAGRRVRRRRIFSAAFATASAPVSSASPSSGSSSTSDPH